jgi:hypothetical protein
MVVLRAALRRRDPIGGVPGFSRAPSSLAPTTVLGSRFTGVDGSGGGVVSVVVTNRAADVERGRAWGAADKSAGWRRPRTRGRASWEPDIFNASSFASGQRELAREAVRVAARREGGISELHVVFIYDLDQSGSGKELPIAN